MTAPDVAPVPPLVDVIAEVLVTHYSDSAMPADLDLPNPQWIASCDCDWEGTAANHSAAEALHAAHQARAVFAALTEAGNAEWGVENGHEPIDHVTEADNQDAAIAEAEDRKAIGIPSRAVSRITWPWTAAE